MFTQNIPNISQPPGPKGYPLLGVIPNLRRDPLNFFLNTAIEYGDVVRLDLGPRTAYLVSDPESIKYILQDNNRNFRKGYEQAKPLMGEGLVTSEGDFWLRQRRLIQPLFLQAQIARYIPNMLKATQDMLKQWDDKYRGGVEFELADEMMRLTQKIILRTMFSIEIGEQAEELGKAFDSSLERLNQILFSPSRIIDNFPTPTNIRHQTALKRLNEFVFAAIAERRKTGNGFDDLLSRLILTRDSETGIGMSDQQIRDEMMTIFLAGHETTANALSWTFYLLSNNLPELKQLENEIDKVLEGRIPAYSDLQELTYTRMVFDEALRLYPPAWMFARHAIESDEIGGYYIPENAMIMISPYVTHRLPHLWEEPDVFDPNRHSVTNNSCRHKFAYIPFGGGPRVCIGNTFAINEAVLIMTLIIQRFRLHLKPDQTVKPTPIATLQPKPGIYVELERKV